MIDERDDLTDPESETDEQARIARRSTYFFQAFGAYNAKLCNSGMKTDLAPVQRLP
jgi:hypothetical protein